MHANSGLIVAAKTLLLHKGRVLLLRRSKNDPSMPGTWELPGGKLEHGEFPQDAALRELREEAGIDAELGPILYADSIVGARTKRQFIILLYVAHASSPHVKLSFEHSDYLWANKSEMLCHVSQSQLQAFERYKTLENPLVDIEDYTP